MQADTVAPNETPLPRAVRERALRAQQLLNESKTPQSETPEVPESQTAPEPTPPAPPVDPRENDPAYWKQRFSVVSGILKRERETRQDESDRLNQEINTLKSEVAQLKSAKPVAANDIDITAFFSPEDIEKLGEDQCRAMARTAMSVTRTELQQQIDAAVKPIQEEAKRSKERGEQQRRSGFEDRLTELVPTYQEIDTDPRWLDWLTFDDPVTGLNRQALLTTYVQRFDAERAASMFTAFLKDTGVSQVAPTPPVAPAASAAPVGELPPAMTTRGYPSQAEIRDYYKRAALGKVKDAEAKEFEARLQLRSAAA